MAAFVRPGQLVADVCSVKVKPVEWMLANLPEHCRILATHPMFGEHSASESLADHNFMLHPVRCALHEYAWLESFLRDHAVRVTEMTPEEHDRIAARSQGVSFFVGQILWAFRPGSREKHAELASLPLRNDRLEDALDWTRSH